MITIEVLVSLLILFMVVATSVTTIKHLNLVQTQQVRYEDVYRAIINIKDYIDADICQKKRVMSGTLNDFEYKAECRQEIEKRKYVKAMDLGDPEGNIDNVVAILSKVVITLKKNNFKKEYSYQKLTTKKVF
ncbi:hypothetical protein [Sulfurimonas autotrophica]|uniref:Type II secretion system protein n=1 Tax=Sulfurimonas autotrophica (strain ATCC BAA-671 / DSM 16294 / JCM 11897 / OK10) TaxID=563040 RepID=E0UU10_SULAO|nr:hypothetical protein [Sulfurimonas autotrophica]ADN08319.1 hypothetical protein Saut_0270 [Sulfurimonas autotrophica DSM 16294]